MTQTVSKKLLDEHRYINIEYDGWWESVYEDFKSDMNAIGIYVNKIYFSGFSSQGDGACFEGCVDDWSLFLPTVGVTDPTVIKLATDAWSWRLEHRNNHYYHENTVSHVADLDNPSYYQWGDGYFAENYAPCSNPLRTELWLAVLNQYDYQRIETDIEEALKQHMRDLYRKLETEYEYLTSDEAVIEHLEANEMLEEQS